MIVWIQLAALKVHFYHREVLTSLGNLIGRTIKLDFHTMNRQRRKFARLAVEIDMSKPLVPRIYLDDHWQKVEYENLPVVCFECGKVGHKADNCHKIRPAVSPNQPPLAGDHRVATPVTVADEVNPGFGPWMLVSKRSRRNSGDHIKKGKTEQGLGDGIKGLSNKNGKGGIRIMEKGKEDLGAATTATNREDSQRPLPQERKGSIYRKEASAASSAAKEAHKGKEVLAEKTTWGKGVLGSGPSQDTNRFNGARPTSEINCTSSLGHANRPDASVYGTINHSSPSPPLGGLSSVGQTSGSSVPHSVEAIIGPNETRMQVVALPSSPKRLRQAEGSPPSAAERTKSKKGGRRQSKKGTPVKLQASKALQV
ncbi:unnamed protein product [Linum trigynum]|uniref:CCHC-type domain-containing protein n=1 Tax=Linum trigynum TaxID=586398 RepID=A0AAV2DGT8_9ROSI